MTFGPDEISQDDGATGSESCLLHLNCHLGIVSRSKLPVVLELDGKKTLLQDRLDRLIPIDAGEHVAVIRWGQFASNSFVFRLRDGEHVHLTCRQSLWHNLILAFFLVATLSAIASMFLPPGHHLARIIWSLGRAPFYLFLVLYLNSKKRTQLKLRRRKTTMPILPVAR